MPSILPELSLKDNYLLENKGFDSNLKVANGGLNDELRETAVD
jgi:hypothetical protein